jgi:carboxypeptidase C (cathepsin A)
MTDNESTWLDRSDLVFIDPVSTGYSRPVGKEEASQYHGLKEDIASVGDFIRLYTSRNTRWLSPKFILGESYGTTRAAGLVGLSAKPLRSLFQRDHPCFLGAQFPGP